MDDETQPGSGAVPGRIIGGQFRIRRRLGAGGMGVVYLADQIGVERPVAIKLIRKELSTDEDISRRFQREARAVGRLNHPGIVQVYTLGQTEDGELFLAMEYVDGRPLSALRDPGRPLPEARLLPLIAEILEALAVAHAEGIVHRDLKPENIMLTGQHGRRDVVKILDFGLVRMFGDDAGMITRTGEVAGTPRYMSPEQARGELLDRQSDIYSLGMIAYELLTGRPPWDVGSPLDYLRLHRIEPIPLPSARAPEVSMDPRTERFVMRCLDKDPSLRYPDGAAALAALRGFLDDVIAPPAPPPAPPVVSATRRSPWPVVLGLVGLVAAFAVAYFGGMAYLDQAGGPSRADTSVGGPSRADSSVGGPSRADSSVGGPSRADSSVGGPSRADSSVGGPSRADSSVGGPSRADSAVGGPSRAELDSFSGRDAPPTAPKPEPEPEASGPVTPPTAPEPVKREAPRKARPPLAAWIDPAAPADVPSGRDAPPTPVTGAAPAAERSLFHGPAATADDLVALAFAGIPVPEDVTLISRQVQALSYSTKESREEIIVRYRTWLAEAGARVPRSLTEEWNQDGKAPLQMLDIQEAPTEIGTRMVTLMINASNVPSLEGAGPRGLFGEWLPGGCRIRLLAPTTVGYHCTGDFGAVADEYTRRAEGLPGVQQIRQDFQGGGAYHLSLNSTDGATISLAVSTIGAKDVVGVTVTKVFPGQY